MIGSLLGCCACAASGHPAAPPRSLISSRRLMVSPAPRTESLTKEYHIFDRELRRLLDPSGPPLMSALGHKRTLKRLHPMSALPPKADIHFDELLSFFQLRENFVHIEGGCLLSLWVVAECRQKLAHVILCRHEEENVVDQPIIVRIRRFGRVGKQVCKLIWSLRKD